MLVFNRRRRVFLYRRGAENAEGGKEKKSIMVKKKD